MNANAMPNATPSIATTASLPVSRSIGTMLIDSGRIKLEEAEQILRLQKEEGLRFGEAAIRLGLLSEDDIQHVLAQQYGYVYLRRGESRISSEMVAAYEPRSPQVEALRALRSQLMLRWFASDGDEPNKMLAIVSAQRGDGRSYLAANLAIVFSQLGENTLLIDADMRNGRQHKIFNVENHTGLSSVLAGRSSTAPVMRLAKLQSLSVLTTGPTPPNPQELLSRDVFVKLLDKFNKMFDIIILDTPASDEYADAQTIAARAGGALMVVRSGRTRLAKIERLSSSLGETSVTQLGAVVSNF